MDRYYNIDNRYLADAMSFLGFRYYKMGFGKDTIYSFVDTELFRENLNQVLAMKRRMMGK